MSSGIKEPKTLPSILSNRKTMSSVTSSESPHSVKELPFNEKSSFDHKLHRNKTIDSRFGSARPRTSSISSIVSLKVKPGGNDHARPASQLSRSSSLLSLGSAGPALRGKKKREAEYAAQKLARQKREMSEFYRDTPVTNPRAKSDEIIRFLYELWGPQLCPNYRKDVPVTTSSRQDLRSVRKIAQTTPRRARKLHRAKLIIETCHEISKPNGMENERSSVISLAAG